MGFLGAKRSSKTTRLESKRKARKLESAKVEFHSALKLSLAFGFSFRRGDPGGASEQKRAKRVLNTLRAGLQ